MPSILTDADKETVRRTVPKPSNKILAVAVARLYVAYPSPHKWTYTGLQGAAVIANDLVGHTFWIKLVDVSTAGRGVLWDQEIYDGFSYNQDRTFFHTFELEECLAGLSFADEKEAKTFLKKVAEREKHASKETKATPFASARGQGPAPVANGKSHHHRFGLGSLLGHRSSSAHAPPPAESIIPPRPEPSDISIASQPRAGPEKKPSPMDTVDPSWKGLLDELLGMGITEKEIEENAEFIKSYIESKQGADAQQPAEIPSEGSARKVKPVPPAPPTAPPPVSKVSALSPQTTGSTNRRGAPPPPPPSRKLHTDGPPSPPRESPPASPKREPSPVRPRFRAPPPIADAGKYAHTNVPAPPARNRAASGSHLAVPGPPPPPRPPKTPEDNPSRLQPPQPPQSQNGTKSPTTPAFPSRGPVPLPPRRNASPLQPPPLPPKTPHATSPSPAPPPPPPRAAAASAPPPQAAHQPPPPSASTVPPPIPSSSGPPPPPPPMPSSSSPAAPPPPSPPLPGANAAPPAPPPPPPGGAPIPKPAPGKDDLMASIRATGGGGLRKVKDSEKRDRSAAMVPGGSTDTPATPSAAPPTGGMMGALQEALAKRKQKVSGSDDEKSDDEW